MKTAVELLESKFYEFETIYNNFPARLYEYIEQAKEMEKKQIIESYCQGCFDINKDNSIFPRETSEQYYKETFKTKKL